MNWVRKKSFWYSSIASILSRSRHRTEQWYIDWALRVRRHSVSALFSSWMRIARREKNFSSPKYNPVLNKAKPLSKVIISANDIPDSGKDNMPCRQRNSPISSVFDIISERNPIQFMILWNTINCRTTDCSRWFANETLIRSIPDFLRTNQDYRDKSKEFKRIVHKAPYCLKFQSGSRSNFFTIEEENFHPENECVDRFFLNGSEKVWASRIGIAKFPSAFALRIAYNIFARIWSDAHFPGS